MNNLSDILAAFQLTEQDIALIRQIAVPLNVKTGKNLVGYGDKCSHIYLVLKGGFVMQLLREADGSERTINFYLTEFQSFMTVPQSFFRDVPSNCKLTAIKNSDVLAFPKHDLLPLLERSQAIRDFYQNQLINALLSELDFRMKLLSLSPQRIYQLLISDYQVLVQNVSSRHIANFIGISPEWLSNLKRNI